MNDTDVGHLAAIVRDSDDAILGKTFEGIITSWNAGAERIYGYSAAEAIGQPVTLIIPPDRADEMATIFHNLTEGTGIDHYDTLRLTKDGRLVNISLTVSPIRDGGGALIGASSIGRDVTQQKEAENALRASARAYQLLMEQASDAILISYPDQCLLEVNQRACEMFGYTREEMLSLTENDLILPETPGSLAPRLDEILAGKIVRLDRPMRCKDETVIVTELSIRRLEDGRIVTIARDITSRKQSELLLQASEARYRAIVEDQTELIARLRPDGTLTFVNEAVCRYLGQARNEVLGSNLFQLVPSIEQGIGLFAPDQRVATSEQRTVTPDGRVQWVHWTIRAFFDEQGNCTEFQVVGVDLTGRRHAEDQLRKSEELYRALSRNLPNGAIMLFDHDLRFLVADGHALEAQGFTKQQAEGKTLRELLSPAALAAVEPYYRAALAGQEHVLEQEYLDSLFRVHFLPVKDEQGVTFAGMVLTLDITEQRRADQARLAQDAAEQANRAKSEFLSRMSHELRTPLNAVLGFAQLLEMDGLAPPQNESIGFILKAGHHLLNLINEVLGFAGVEEGTLSISIEAIFLRDVLHESLDLVQPLAAARQIEMRADLDWMDDCFIMADRQRLRQVLLNLLANAIKYNRQAGSVTLVCALVPGNDDDQQQLRFSIRDTGPGLTSDQLARLFTPFDRLGAEQTDIEGTGLGLALARTLVEAMGGTIGATSELGQGSTFWVDLAVTKAPGAETDQQRPEPPLVLRGDMPAVTVLYIEDNLSNFRLVEAIFSRWPNISLLVAMQGQLGLDMAAAHQPDLILLDQHLPDITGQIVLRRLGENPRTAAIPVMVISADANPARQEMLLSMGARAYLTKPLDVVQFLATIDTILQSCSKPVM